LYAVRFTVCWLHCRSVFEACFHPRPRICRTTVPWSNRPRFIPSCLRAPSEFLRFSSRFSSFDVKHTYQGSFPLRGVTRAHPLFTGSATSPLCSVLRLSQPLDGLLRPLAPRACSIPQPRPGFIPFRGFSLRAAALPRRKRLASLPLVTIRSPSENDAHEQPPRPRGLAPHEEAFRRFGVTRPFVRSPRRVSSSFRFPFRLGRRFPVAIHS